MSKAKLGTFDELIDGVGPEMQKIAKEARAIIRKLHADTTEVVRLGDRAATYGLGPKKMSEGYAYISPQSGHVNLGFFYGASLPDPDGLLEGTGKNMRHVKLRSSADVKKARGLVEAALTERRRALGRD